MLFYNPSLASLDVRLVEAVGGGEDEPSVEHAAATRRLVVLRQHHLQADTTA